jgi:hypothetical protein
MIRFDNPSFDMRRLAEPHCTGASLLNGRTVRLQIPASPTSARMCLDPVSLARDIQRRDTNGEVDQAAAIGEPEYVAARGVQLFVNCR